MSASNKLLPISGAFVKYLPYIEMAVALSISFWVLLGILSCGWLAFNVPLTAQDLDNASWLGSPTTALHFTTGPMAYLLGSALILTGIATSMASGTPIPSFLAGVIVCAAAIGGSHESVVRIGLLDGTVKLGCYVEKSKECLDMLKLGSTAAPSRWDLKGRGPAHPHSEWYAQELDKVVSPAVKARVIWTAIPGGAVLRAPVHLLKAQKLQSLVKEQRKQLAAFKAAQTKAN